MSEDAVRSEEPCSDGLKGKQEERGTIMASMGSATIIRGSTCPTAALDLLAPSSSAEGFGKVISNVGIFNVGLALETSLGN